MSTSRSGGLLGQLRPTEEERRRALEDPGVSWREWFYFTFLKTWLGLGFLVADALLASAWAESRNYLGLAVSLAAVVYLEFLAFRYLWTRPGGSEQRKSSFARSWHRPVWAGRWTPESWYPERYRAPQPGASGPDPNDFL
ncbi:MAG TPA: hypothetical protein VJQ43_04735 [Thermoplasmata archaeon]|nr:hypothetical protein [Thermoplasmata archaeon]